MGQSFQSKVVSITLLTDGKFLDTISEVTTSKFFENDGKQMDCIRNTFVS